MCLKSLQTVSAKFHCFVPTDKRKREVFVTVAHFTTRLLCNYDYDKKILLLKYGQASITTPNHTAKSNN